MRFPAIYPKTVFVHVIDKKNFLKNILFVITKPAKRKKQRKSDLPITGL